MKKRIQRLIALTLFGTVLFSSTAIHVDSIVGDTTNEEKSAEEKSAEEKSAEGIVVAKSDDGRNEQIATGEQETSEAQMPVGDPDNKIDYGAIIDEISEPEYRDDVEIKENEVVVVRSEDENTEPLEEEEWYEEIEATGYEVVSEDEQVDDNGDTVNMVGYVISTAKKDPWEAVDYINSLGVVEIAEPNYIYTLADEGVPSEEKNEGMGKQWYLKDQNVLDVWGDPDKYGNTTGEGIVVAVIDTGVDYTHEDLKNNIWINTAEIGGREGADDDNNGYVDDMYGINLIDPAATSMDDNGHGTHVAGIIAMENNNTGGVGIAYKSKIMAIKAGDSDGSFSSSDITRAVTYAYKNGADVINMSFGGYGHSAIVEGAMQDAFSTSVLVAAAGNDGIPTADHPFALIKGNMYPACYSYVLGVMAYDSTGNIAAFSNWDYKPSRGPEYEIAAPGVEIYSTLPNNRYATWSGTSMATPVVAAVAAIIRSSKSDKDMFSSRYIMGQIASATEDKIAFLSKYNDSIKYARLSLRDSLLKMPKPNIYIDSVYTFDSKSISAQNNEDGIIQPGEVIDFAIGLRNQWGAATDVVVTMNATSVGGIDNKYVEFLNGQEASVDDIGTFGSQNNGFIYDENRVVVGVENPIRVKIKENAPNDLNIAFNINFHARNALDSEDKRVYQQGFDTVFTISIVKGTVLSGKITNDMTLSSDEYYIVKNSLLIPKGVTVDVEPGTKIQFWGSDQTSVYGDDYIANISVQGKMNFNGTEAKPIELFPGKDFEAYRVQVEKSVNGIVNMDYVNVINPYLDITSATHLNCIQDYDIIYYRYFDNQGVVRDSYGGAMLHAGKMCDSIVSNLRGRDIYSYADVAGNYDTVLFENNQISYRDIQAVNCAFLINQGRVENPYSGELEYHTSLMGDVGDTYMTPQYEPMTKIYTVNNKKYIAYKFDNYVYSSEWDENGTYISHYYDNFIVMKAAIERLGGTIACVDSKDEKYRSMFESMIEDLEGDKKPKNAYYMMAGCYYDWDSDKVVGPKNFANGLNPNRNNPLTYYYMAYETYYDYDEVGNPIEHAGYRVNQFNTNAMHGYIIAEFPATTSDYNVKNPNFEIKDLGILKATKFTNNAILNRLTSTEISNWMKLSGMRGNLYTYMVANNYWGTVDKMLIQKQLIDFDTNINYADYITSPELTTPAESTYPCVADIIIKDGEGNTVTNIGNGDYEVHVLFNRKMNTSIVPMVTYGPDDPYTDYSIKGEWKSSKEWVGTMNIRILINQGIQYFRVKNAVAANDGWLKTGTDWGRFSFIVEATGAEALTLQAEGIKGGVYLNWIQDEYDTMAGYNIYRSETGEEGTYKKINTSIVSPTDKEYTDTKVKCGKLYYYYFTVVDTDMNESRPSNIIQCASIDDEPPVISHSAASSINFGINASVLAAITDNVGVNNAVLNYRMRGESGYKQVTMTNTSGNAYSAQIPARDITLGVLEYFISAMDSLNVAYSGTELEPYSVPIEAVPTITAVSASEMEVGEEQQVSIAGINFTEDCKVRFEGEIVKSKFVSEQEITFKAAPKYLGKKKIEIVLNDTVLSSFANAITVTDPNACFYNDPQIVIREANRSKQYNLYTNVVGKIESLEIVYQQGRSTWIYPKYSAQEKTGYNDNLYDCLYKYEPHIEASGKLPLAYIYSYGYADEEFPVITAVKINGVTVKNDYDRDRFTYIDSDMYVPVESVEVNNDFYSLEIGDTFTPDITVLPSNASLAGEIEYSFDAGSFRQNEDGSFTVLKSGYNYVNIGCDGKSSRIEVYANPIKITDIIPDKSSYVGTVGSTITINVTVEPSDADRYISWSSGNGVSISSETNSGRTIRVRLQNVCESKIYTQVDGKYYSIPIRVIENTSYIDIQEEIVTLYPNQTISLNALIKNESGEGEYEVSWKSSNESVVKVSSNGKLTGVGKGYAVISAAVGESEPSDTVIVLVGTDSMSYSIGDINMDGKVTSVDAMLALKLATADSIVASIEKVADVNNDGKVTTADAMLILQYVTGAIKEF